ncbi:hypothetical protein RHMOL_Rhmol08G0281700 [Rhododendron molle]|uniref:Uncharacterized protein n=1 Tax=Rhododendron molle TaxID=49168 RepID=A0ACC0MTD3_RHOML|nr:hypothetical protein RHMOL_Rhmol08G0281700 [Rhododendron molle]
MDSGFTLASQLQIGSPYPDRIVNREDTFRDDIGTDNRWEEVSQHFSSDFSTTFTFRKVAGKTEDDVEANDDDAENDDNSDLSGNW